MASSQQLAGGQPEDGQEGQQIRLQLLHGHAVGGVGHSNAGIMANLANI